MSLSHGGLSRVVPAQLNFLTIYNPRLNATSETEYDQIVFYYSQSLGERSKRKNETYSKRSEEDESTSEREKNERLRQIGLAQGMVNFARQFSNGRPVDSVETEKHRIVIYELESSWWILASINLTCIPSNKVGSSKDSDQPISVEYSAREISPPALLIEQLTQAYRVFLLHHGRSLTDIYENLKWERFCDILDRYWTRFVLNWDVLLHGNPSADIYGGIKLAAGGELGIGVGEEDWGSGEREVLEGLVRSTSGLVDLVLSRYGGSEDERAANSPNYVSRQTGEPDGSPWIGTGSDPGPDDGLIFSGQGVLTRKSLQSLTEWIRSVYVQGEDAYGVRDNPSSFRRKRKRRKPSSPIDESSFPEARKDGKPSPPIRRSSSSKGESRPHPSIPPPIVSAAEESLSAAIDATGHSTSSKNNKTPLPLEDENVSQPWMKYLTLGYGSVWGPSSKAADSNNTHQTLSNTSVKSSAPVQEKAISQKEQSTRRTSATKFKSQTENLYPQDPKSGHFIIGLRGSLDDDDQPGSIDEDKPDKEELQDNDWTSRLSLRTLHLQVIDELPQLNEDNEEYEQLTPSETTSTVKLLRVVVYIHRPFVYTLLFDPNSASLTFPTFYHDLHHHLTPLHGPLLRSTSPQNVARRLKSVSSTDKSPVFDVVHSPRSLATRCSIPNIPEPNTVTADGSTSFSARHSALASTIWSRSEALSVHTQILQTYIDTRSTFDERERTMKTSRGWWIVWMDVPTAIRKETDDNSSTKALVPEDQDEGMHSEAVLVRKAQGGAPAKSSWIGGGYSSSSLRLHKESTGSAFGRLMGRETNASSGNGSSAAGANSPGRLTEGIGMSLDPKKYVEVLLSLNR